MSDQQHACRIIRNKCKRGKNKRKGDELSFGIFIIHSLFFFRVTFRVRSVSFSNQRVACRADPQDRLSFGIERINRGLRAASRSQGNPNSYEMLRVVQLGVRNCRKTEMFFARHCYCLGSSLHHGALIHKLSACRC